MRTLLALTAPLLIGSLLLWGAGKGVDLYGALVAGARKGLGVLWDILPAMLALFPAISLLRVSGLPELLGRLLAPALDRLGIPEELTVLMLLRPLSGSGALAAASELIAAHGADSLVGRAAAVMLGSSETTFYVTAVYLAAAGVKHSRWAIPAALCADLVCFVSSAWISRLLWG